MIDGKIWFNQPVQSYTKTYEGIQKLTTGQGDDHTAGCLLDCSYFKKHYKILAIDLSKLQALDAYPKAIKQISFTGNLDGNNNRLLFFIIEEVKETILVFSQGSVIVLWVSSYDVARVAKGFDRTACSTILFCFNKM